MNEIADRIRCAVFGQAVGDALGVPVEFVSRTALKADPVTDMRGYGSHNQPPGTWSDDTSLMLCLLESLSEGFDINKLAGKFIAWRDQGYLTPHGKVFDIGITTSNAISRLKAGISPLEAGDDGERSNGNGSLMRILPVAFETDLSDLELGQFAEQVSCLTHRHPRSQMACGLFVLFCRRLLKGLSLEDAYIEGGKVGFDIYSGRNPFKGELPHFQRYLKGNLPTLHEDEIGSSGYVIHTLEASTWSLLTSDSYEEAVLKAVNLGDDSDTTGAVTGALAGAAWGLNTIPTSWLDHLARKGAIEKLVDGFLKHAGEQEDADVSTKCRNDYKWHPHLM